MIETLDSNPQPESSSLNPDLLAHAWQVFTFYDISAVKFQKRFLFLRKLILSLSVVATILAVILQVMKHGSTSDVYQLYPNNIFLNYLVIIINFFVIITPITISVLLAGSVKFGRGVNWILLRGSTETIKQEIYRYRTQVGDYNNVDVNVRDAKFAQEIQTISERLMKTKVNQSGLVWNGLKSSNDATFIKDIKQVIGEQDSYPFSSLTAEQYIDYRLIDQLSWYRKKIVILDKEWQVLQWLIYVLGGIGTFLAAINMAVWIAVSNAVAASLLSFLEFKKLDTTLVGYNQTATNLENILCWWHALTPESKNDPKNRGKLVDNSENVIRAETTGWVQEMRDAMATLYEEKKPPKKDEDSKDIDPKKPPKENEVPSKDENEPLQEENERSQNADNKASDG